MGSVNTPRQFPTRPPIHSQNKTPTQQQLKGLSGGLSGIRSTLHYMREYVNQYKTAPQVRELALSLTRRLPQKDFRGELNALFNYVQNHIRYVRDVYDVETIQTPVKTLEYGQGDCDDKSSLLAALLESIGHKTRFKAVGFTPGQISHVLLEANVLGEWIPLETTEPVALGWTPPRVREQIIVSN